MAESKGSGAPPTPRGKGGGSTHDIDLSKHVSPREQKSADLSPRLRGGDHEDVLGVAQDRVVEQNAGRRPGGMLVEEVETFYNHFIIILILILL